ncbi:hypothetical protein GCM10017786_09630 [Amycolatopsis deserti]|uniref:PNPLA domain-containing protein n=1 Tax=Amycolatopsis deserti TaxID=185696 RepID=A0ABQ3IHE6_9PSEU|nr:hypothetical protein [Amycolatopsis deserti]GHE81326.1 hypothetical protein GCM10017786_09630 [Amycolatopsis deserti]
MRWRELLPRAGEVPGRGGAGLTAVAALVLAAAGAGVYLAFAEDAGIVGRELGGRAQPLPFPPGTAATLWWDFALIAGYGLAILLGTTAALWVTQPHTRTHEVARFARIAGLVAVISDVLENVLLLVATRNPDPVLLEFATAAAVTKFAGLLPALLLALYGIALTLIRCVRPAKRDVPAGVCSAALKPDDPDGACDEGEATASTRWRNGYRLPPGEPTGGTGFCLSGGGIRSASVALGALQPLRQRLLGAQYLVSVSGGGYTAGALVQALTTAADPKQAPPGEPVATPETAFGPGSVEEDHVRRHVSYLANTPAELLTALGVLARGLLLSLFLVFAPAVVLGVVTGWLYRQVPLTVFPADGGYPAPRPGALLSLGLTLVVAAVVSLVARWIPPARLLLRQVARRLSSRLALLAALIALLTLGLPALAWLADRLLTLTPPTVALGSPFAALLLTYVSTLAAIGWRNRKVVTKARDSLDAVTAALPTSLTQRLLVIVTITVLALAWLLLFASVITPLGEPDLLWAALGLVVVLVVLGGLIDETSLSLHPFYRERLACTFAVRRIRRPDGQVVAAPYPSTERSSLATYGHAAGFPRVVFAAAANLTGEGRTSPGLDAVSYTMSSGWVGGPDVGWIETARLQESVPGRFQRDLTVQGAVAISGAAFASSMGRASRWYQILLALSGARLGTWLPNPDVLLRCPPRTDRAAWAYPPLPHARRLPYLLREVLGIHSHADRLLHVTDGGHYDNLGLVELFRRRCTTIYCIDAGADSPPSASGLASALALATQELGVRVTLDDPWRAEPGGGEPLEPEHPLSALNSRLSESPVITGTIHYPAESGQAGVGLLIVAKALLWRDLPYELLSYAAHHPEFPRDGTSDQFFDDSKFGAYIELGRQLGKYVVTRELPAAADLPEVTEGTGVPDGVAPQPAGS